MDERVLTINFIDNGFGIPEKQQELIFNRFTRGTNVSNKGMPGTGIGLMLSKKIVELHGGKIILESKENIGSKFTIELPSGTQHYKNDQISYEINNSSSNSVDELLHQDQTILLVEDNQVIGGGLVFSKSPPDMWYAIDEANKWFDKGYLYIGFIFVLEEKRHQNLGSVWLNQLKAKFPNQKYWLTIEDLKLDSFYVKNDFKKVKSLFNENQEEWLYVFEPKILM